MFISYIIHVMNTYSLHHKLYSFIIKMNNTYCSLVTISERIYKTRMGSK